MKNKLSWNKNQTNIFKATYFNCVFKIITEIKELEKNDLAISASF